MSNHKPINVDVSKLETQICPRCECPYCHEVFQLRHLPALMSPNGQAQLIKVPAGFACNNCGSGMFEPVDATTEDTKEKDSPTISLVN